MTGDQIRRAVRETANQGRCQLGCGRPADNYAHRLPAGAGGGVTLANGLALCGSGTTGCHWSTEQARELAYQCGWLLRRGQDPTMVPALVIVDGIPGWWRYDIDGHAHPIHTAPAGMWPGTFDAAAAALHAAVKGTAA